MLNPGWYLLPCPVIATYWRGHERTQGVIPAGWYECVSVSGDTAQLSAVARMFPGQTTRFVVRASELEDREYYRNRVDIR